MNRTEIANQIKAKQTFKMGNNWVFIHEVIEGTVTIVKFSISEGNTRSLWIGELIDLIQEMEIPNNDKCRKCNGTGITVHVRVQGGRCFRCGGDGRESTYRARKAEEKAQEAYRNSPEGKAAYQAYLKDMRENGVSLY